MTVLVLLLVALETQDAANDIQNVLLLALSWVQVALCLTCASTLGF
jgi:hypothetical protein